MRLARDKRKRGEERGDVDNMDDVNRKKVMEPIQIRMSKTQK